MLRDLFTKMKILVITTRMPFPLDNGGKLRTYNLLRRLSEKHWITLVTFEPEETPPQAFIQSICRKLITVPEPNNNTMASFCFNLLSAPFCSDPLTVRKYTSDLLAKAIRDHLSRETYDIIHCESTPLARTALQAAGSPDCVGTQNVEAQIWLRYAETSVNPLKRFFMFDQYRKMFKYESETYRYFARVLVVSNDDRRLMVDWYRLDSVVVPNGVDTEYFQPGLSERDPSNIAYVGAMDWRPNQDAVLYFLHEIWPIVKAKVPKVTFSIVGRKPPKSILKVAALDKSIEVTGTVKDVRPNLCRASVCVVPLRIGGGSRLKILEALATCTPVVSTTVGAEGLKGIEPWVAIEDNPRAFAERVIHLLKSPTPKEKMQEARKFVAEQYSWKASAERIESVWNDLLKTSRPELFQHAA